MMLVYTRLVEWVSSPPPHRQDYKDPNAMRWTARLPRHELVAWGDETWLAGEWEVREDHVKCGYVVVAKGGGEKDAAAAKLRAAAVYTALTETLSDASATL